MTRDWRDIPYSKGFVLTKHRLDQVAHYELHTLPGGWHLWADSATETELATTQDSFVVLRGHWVDTSDDASQGATAEQLLADMMRNSESAFHRRLSRLGGRYVIIVKMNEELYVYNDATGLRSVYYSVIAPLVASHLNLLLRLQIEQPEYTYKETLHALDATPYSNVRQLLPNFRLEPESSLVERFYPFEQNPYSSFTSEERLAHVEKLWQRVMNHYTSLTDKLALSITGGLDSKLMLAMCRQDASRFIAYTYGKTEGSDARSKSLNFDFQQVQYMLPYLAVKSHEFLDITKPGPVPAELNRVIRSNTWASHGRYLLPLYRSLFPSDGWYHLRGNGVEIVRRFWPGTSTTLADLLKPITDRQGPPLNARAQQLGYGQPQFGYNISDLLYWEVRMGKWHAELVNEQDAAFETFIPLSVRDIIDPLLAFPTKERKEALAIYELINRNKAILNFWGANDSRNIYEQYRDYRLQQTKNAKEDAGGEDRSRNFESKTYQELFLNRHHFHAGTSVEKSLCKSNNSGAASFKIDQPYRKEGAEGYFEWEVRVDGVPKIRCDGALTRTPTTITVWNMSPGIEISVALVARKTVLGDAASWERASRLRVTDFRYYIDHFNGDERLTVASDNPYALRL